MRGVVVFLGVLLSAGPIVAQRGATGPVATLNAEAEALHETDPVRSMAIAQKALAAAKAASDVRGEAEALNFVAYGYRNQSQLGLAKQNAEASVRLFVSASDPYGESQGYNTLGLIAADDGKFAEALEYHLKALAIRERTGDTQGLAYTYNNLGNAYRNMGEYAKALSYHEQGLALKVELGNKVSEAYSHHNIGLVYFAMGDTAKALAAYRRGLAIRETLDDTRGIAVSLNSIGLVEAQTNPSGALKTYERALALRRSTQDQRGEMATELNMGDVYRRMGDLTRATAAFTRALALGDQIDAPLMRSNALKGLAEVEAARGDYRASSETTQPYHAAREARFNKENAGRMQRLQTEHEADRQQRTIEILQKERDLRAAELSRASAIRTGLVVTVLLGAVSLVLLFGRYRLKQQSEARFKAQAAELQLAMDRVQTLKGLLPICASCKKIRDDNGYWTQVEAYVAAHSAAEFTHSICPNCFDSLYPEMSSAGDGRHLTNH